MKNEEFSGCLLILHSSLFILHLFIFVPTLDGNVINAHRAKCIDKRTCQTGICYQRDIRAFVINGIFKSIAARRIL